MPRDAIEASYKMNGSLNLRHNLRTYVLFGILVILIALLMLINPSRSWGDVVFGSFLMLGGFFSITYVNRLVVDKNANELVHQKGVIVPLHRKRYALQKVRAVRVSEKTVRSGDNECTTYPVELSGIRDATVLNHGNPWFSRVLAEQLARLINVPLVNRVYGTASARKPDELDVPLVERWIRDNERFERPPLTHSADLQESSQGSSYELSIRAEFPKLKYLIGFLFLLVLPAVIDVPFADLFHSRAYRILAVFFLGAGILALAFVGRSKLTITDKDVSFRQGYFPMKARLGIQDIEEMIVAGDGITLVGDTKAVWVHWGGSKRQSDYLEAVIPYQLLRLGKYGMSNIESG